jgi:hypothetical protein
MSVSDAELVKVLEPALQRRIRLAGRRAWDYTSSAPIEELAIEGCPPLLFKDLSRRSDSAPAFVVDPLREIEVYTSYLSGLDAPVFVAGAATEGRAWLFIERVDGIPLWQAGGDEPWLSAARWLARLHRMRPPAHGGRLLARDDELLQRWVERALASEHGDALKALVEPSEHAIDLLGAWPTSLLHGEFYPSNVIVQQTRDGSRIRAIDWEMAGLGAGVLDLAALTSGDHDPGLRRAIVAAYRDECGSLPDGFDETLRAARLLIAMQWIGWRPGWTAPAEHVHDWVADAVVYAEGRDQ